ncbi:hypothetical protein PROFUN_05450 [Planoprotostelium fungivorum]|uniref:Dolichol-phosphate mannosyltransferase subunit 1 n=1 Tax=Planoprotostelium fungivorum TaxID=1890364 RepID=A0A2P6NQS7_9EUKA|nr:hypothetical protein PROFUN_05450 [Planoprotostelium fungivorum]
MTTQRNNQSKILASVVVPTYKEVANIRPLVTRLVNKLENSPFGTINRNNIEIIFVDDNSKDGSKERAQELKDEGYPVVFIERTTERGLSSAVLRGFNDAKGDLLLCMDADLQHPPEKAPELLEALVKNKDADFVLGTRYGEGVEIDPNWPMHRVIISKVARSLSRPLTPLSDPMSGFFGLRKSTLEQGKKINPIGFKIALELYVKCGCKNSTEVPFSFGVREAGESKLSGKVIVKYIEQLVELYSYTYGQAFIPAVLITVIFFGIFVLMILYRLFQ